MRSRPALASAAVVVAVLLALNVLSASASAAPAPGHTTTTASAIPRISTQGAPVTYTATVTAASGTALTGTVAFTVGSRHLCTATVLLTPSATSTARCRTTTTPVGTDTVTATYSGDATFARSTGSISVRVNRPAPAPASTTTMGHAVVPLRGDPVYYATVTSASALTPTGRVTFTLGTQRICSVEVRARASSPKGTSQGNCGAHRPPDGDYTVTATYSGDTRSAGSSGVFSFNIATKFGY